MDSSGRLLTAVVNMTNHIILSGEHLHAIRALSTTFIIIKLREFIVLDIRKLVGLGCADLAAHEVDGDGPREEEVG